MFSIGAIRGPKSRLRSTAGSMLEVISKMAEAAREGRFLLQVNRQTRELSRRGKPSLNGLSDPAPGRLDVEERQSEAIVSVSA